MSLNLCKGDLTDTLVSGGPPLTGIKETANTGLTLSASSDQNGKYLFLIFSIFFYGASLD